MNKLPGKIRQIQRSHSIRLVEIESCGFLFSSLLLESGEKDLFEEGEEVFLLFKETELSLAKKFSGQISLRNQFPCRIKETETGDILSKIVLDFQGYELTSIITTRSAQSLLLQAEDLVTGLLKTNELLLQKKVF